MTTDYDCGDPRCPNQEVLQRARDGIEAPPAVPASMMPTTLALARVLVLIPAELVSVKVEGVTFGASLHSRVTCSRKHGPALVTMHPDLLTALQLALQELTQ